MNHARRLHRAASSLALLAVLAFTLLPTLSRALAAAGGWTEVCTPGGTTWRAADDTGGAPRPTLDACSHCTLAAHAPPPVLPRAIARPPAGVAEQAAPTLQAALPRVPWQRAQPRAPPAQA